MKAKIIEKQKKFESITIELTIESAEELCDLWHRLNIGAVASDYGSYDVLKHHFSSDVNYSMWSTLNTLILDLNLRIK